MNGPVREVRELDPHLELVRRLMVTYGDISAEANRAFAADGLGEWSSNATVALLTKLTREGPTRPRGLLESTALTRGGLSNLFDRLEGAGLIDRVYGQVPGDRRGATVAITDVGATVATELSQSFARSVRNQHAAVAALSVILAELSVRQQQPISEATSRSSMGQLEQLGRLGAQLVEASSKIAPDDPTPGKTVAVLCNAVEPGRTRPKDLRRITGLSSGGVSQLLDRLESADLIHRRNGVPTDRRAVVIDLTDAGNQWLERFLRAAARHLEVLHPSLDLTDVGSDA